MSEVLESAKAYLDGTHKDGNGDGRSLIERLARFSDPFISADGDLCVNIRTYERSKKIHGKFIKMPGIVVNLESADDVDALMGYLKDIRDNMEVLREVAQERRKRWTKFRRK